jgi:hypothetical protein
MSCNSHTLVGIGLGCKDNMGGIKEVYLIKESEITDIQLDEAGSAVASITLADSATFKTYRFRKGTSSMSSTMTTDEAAGTLSVQTDLALQFSKMETAKRLEIMAMCMDSLKGIVLDSNGKYWLLGYDYPITASAATGNTGTAFADFGGYNVTLTDNSKEFPFEIPLAVMTTLEDKITAAPVGN